MFRSILAARSKRVLLCFVRCIPKALAAAFVFSFAMFIAFIFVIGEEIPCRSIVTDMTIFFLFFWVTLSFADVIRFRNNIFHQFDDKLIGNAFTGMDHKSRRFEYGVELFHKNDFRMALEVFTDIGREEQGLTQGETAVNEFYRGRCYHILEAFPNAIICYEKAKENGFYIPELPIFIARCHVMNGDTARATAIYEQLMEENDYKYSGKLRCEMGNMFIFMDDGETALKWFSASINNHENFANALGGAAIAHVMMGDFEKGEACYRQAIMNNIDDAANFARFYKVTVALYKPKQEQNQE